MSVINESELITLNDRLFHSFIVHGLLIVSSYWRYVATYSDRHDHFSWGIELR